MPRVREGADPDLACERRPSLMAWAKLDDRFHENRKVRRAWRRCPASIGLYAMALTYCSGNMTDGHVPVEFVEDQFRRDRDQEQAVGALVDARLWVAVDDGWQIPDFTEFNPSRREAERTKAARSEAARTAARARWDRMREQSDDACDPDASTHASSHMRPMRSDAPDPTRARPVPEPVSPDGDTAARDAPLAAVADLPGDVRSMLSASGFDESAIREDATAIRVALSELQLPDDVDWWRFGQEIERAARGGKLRSNRPSSAIKFVARGMSGPPRAGQGPARQRSAFDHYADMHAEVVAEQAGGAS
ncbi:MAG: hypothetical protein M0P31_17035 [Solirubrobacteraceae bacterium]|nr:hypothetical protein [Solirubrobacteraceae bacterium]